MLGNCCLLQQEGLGMESCLPLARLCPECQCGCSEDEDEESRGGGGHCRKQRGLGQGSLQSVSVHRADEEELGRQQGVSWEQQNPGLCWGLGMELLQGLPEGAVSLLLLPALGNCFC